MTTPTVIRDTRRWTMLALGVLAQASSAVFVHGTAFLLPELTAEGKSLGAAGVLVAMPLVGLVLTLIVWGAVVDRIGERKVLVIGLTSMAIFGTAASLTTSDIGLGTLLLLGGMAAASTNGASGRVIVGWFPAQQRGMAMGIRQTAQPLGVAIGAVTIPTLAAAHSVTAAILVPAVMGAVAAIGCLFGVIDPPRPAAAEAERIGLLANPYRADATLWRIHGVSVLLVIPQATVWTFGLVWLNHDVGLAVGLAGAIVTATQIFGAAGRIGAGIWSDRVGSRMRPLRTIAVAAVLTMAALGLSAWAQAWWLAIPLLVVASVVTVADNGLAFTAVAEIAGPYWSGRGLGVQNTGQNLATAAVPPVLGALITATGFSAAYLVAALIAVCAVPLVPRDRLSPALD